jgi:membrane protease YdiL (CAAX protease family)
VDDSLPHRLDVLYGNQASRENTAQSTSSIAPHSAPIFPILFTSVLFALMHSGQGPAPIALFFYSLALGYAYHRTGSLVPSIVMHMLLNVYSLTLATLS